MKKLILLLVALLMSLTGLSSEDSATAQESSSKDPQPDRAIESGNDFFSAWNPDSEILHMHQQMQRLMQMTSLQARNRPALFNSSLGSAALKDMKSEYQLGLDWPEMDKNKIQITVAQHRLRISGEQKIENEYQDEHSNRVETSFRSVERIINLPEDADEEQVSADYKKNRLIVHIAKKAPPEPERKVAVN